MCATEEMKHGVAAGVSQEIVEISAVVTPGQSRAMSSSNGYATNDSCNPYSGIAIGFIFINSAKRASLRNSANSGSV
jgi:hypothetical protein